MPPADRLPPPSLEYEEMEACQAFHYPGWAAWVAEDAVDKARLIAHEWARSMREGFAREKMNEWVKRNPGKSPGAAPVASGPWDSIQKHFGLGPK